jgi:hypothetical protein
VGVALAAAAVSACGSASTQTQTGSRSAGGQRSYPVAIDAASFPSSQSVAQSAEMVISVRNTGQRTIPNLAVTVCNVTCRSPAPAGEGSSAPAFGDNSEQPNLANPGEPLWVVDRPPGVCSYSCLNGGRGGAVTAYSNTWSMGPLRPGHTARFDWQVTPISPGRHVVAWTVAATLGGRGNAVLAGGGAPAGTFTVDVGNKPPQTYVNNSGQIVTAP